MEELQRGADGPLQRSLAAEHHVAVADDGAGLPDIPHILGNVEGHGAKIAAHHGVEQNNAVLNSTQSLIGSKELAAAGRPHTESPFRLSHILDHISLAARLD